MMQPYPGTPCWLMLPKLFPKLASSWLKLAQDWFKANFGGKLELPEPEHTNKNKCFFIICTLLAVCFELPQVGSSSSSWHQVGIKLAQVGLKLVQVGLNGAQDGLMLPRVGPG